MVILNKYSRQPKQRSPTSTKTRICIYTNSPIRSVLCFRALSRPPFNHWNISNPNPYPVQKNYPTPPHPTPYGVFGNFMGVSSYLLGHGLAAVAPGHGQVALGAKKVALGPGPPGPRHFLRPKRHLTMAWRRHRQAMAK